MADKLTEKQEAFARYVAEGDTYSGAYRKAYDAENMLQKSIHEKASELMANVKVRSRVMELQELAQERTLVTVESLTREYEEARLKALEDGQAAASVSATTGKAKLHGMFEDHNKQRALTVVMESDTDKL